MMSTELLDVQVGAGEVSGCPGLPLEAQDGGMGRCGKSLVGGTPSQISVVPPP